MGVGVRGKNIQNHRLIKQISRLRRGDEKWVENRILFAKLLSLLFLFLSYASFFLCGKSVTKTCLSCSEVCHKQTDVLC